LYAAARLYIAWQWDRYLVPQNVFLVNKKLHRQFRQALRLLNQ